MKFGEILSKLQEGKVVRRKVFQSNLVIFMQIPTMISGDGIPAMRSIPDDMKALMCSYGVGITYHDQFIMYDFSDRTCTYYPFDGEDINADDWEVVDPLTYDPYDDFR